MTSNVINIDFQRGAPFLMRLPLETHLWAARQSGFPTSAWDIIAGQIAGTLRAIAKRDGLKVSDYSTVFANAWQEIATREGYGLSPQRQRRKQSMLVEFARAMLGA